MATTPKKNGNGNDKSEFESTLVLEMQEREEALEKEIRMDEAEIDSLGESIEKKKAELIRVRAARKALLLK